ncbi:hypothetical protein BDM02DRAFT_3183308 [Thelephora ganbajun]|uniref:Uncharacterized protein n=1 Tax=Thelephora ganbajun TaxID=370292 RepID=A0ACB6ZUC5_THEGA|nr:hypothetical protein BDM02DRAFT_3183308 [Thelephora ganbajun]
MTRRKNLLSSYRSPNCVTGMPQARFTIPFILGIFFENVLYGVFVPFLLTACYAQCRKLVKGRSVNKVMVFATVFYGLTITLHWVVSTVHGLRGILFLPSGGDTATFFQNTSSPLFVCKVTLLQIEILVGDWIMIYRLYHIYGRNLAICIVPLVGSLAHLAIILGSAVKVIHTYGPATLTAWAAACFSVTIL